MTPETATNVSLGHMISHIQILEPMAEVDGAYSRDVDSQLLRVFGCTPTGPTVLGLAQLDVISQGDRILTSMEEPFQKRRH